MMKIYPIALIIFLTLDLLWLGVFAKGFYSKHIGFLLKDNPSWIPALIFYALFVLGMSIFVILPNIDKDIINVIAYGALFGLVTYACYDLTNQALTKEWPWIVTVVDLVWGAFISSFTSTVVYLIVKYF